MWECRTIARSPTGEPRSRTADRQEVERAVEIASGGHPEVGRADRRHEPGVEGLGDPEGRMDPVPSRAQRELVQAKPPGVEHAMDLDLREVRIEEAAVLVDGVLAQMPRVLRLLGAGWREGQAVRRGDVGERCHPGKLLE